MRDAAGELRVLEDNVRTPTLMAFAVAARRLVAPALPDAPRPRPIEDALRTVIDGRLEPRHVDLRPFVIGGRVLPGGLCRFALGAGELVVNCAQGGGGKDVWVLSD